MSSTDLDVLIIGAGLSGIGVAAHLTRACPDRTYALVERREAIGGTWDLFRYPGIRCDSDMSTLGYSFRPWPRDDVTIGGAELRGYIEDTAAEYGVTEHIRFGHRVLSAEWSTPDARWTVRARREADGEEVTFRAGFVVSCSGYYSYDEAHTPAFPGLADFEGEVVHSQFWDPDRDWTGQRVVVIGSGASAVTIVPAMVGKAEHVTMLQRSPSYYLTLPRLDPSATMARRVLPDRLVHDLHRMRNTALQMGLFRLAKWKPDLVRSLLLSGVRQQLRGKVDMRHFEPRYKPWDERLCAVPDGDLFEALRTGEASIVTDHVDHFTRDGIVLRSGRVLEADLVVCATGLTLRIMGGVEVVVDGEAVDPTKRLAYKSVLIEDVPNLALVMGYVNVSWTRKVEMVAEYLARLLERMEREGMRQATPRGGRPHATDEPFIEMTSGYLERARHLFPVQGRKGTPWRTSQNVFVDLLRIRMGRIQDDFLELSNPPVPGRRRGPAPRGAARAA